MEALRPLVISGFIDEATAQAIADERATVNMVKYVHNPKDKTLWETNMRVAAPFYFAQNQAWRRAFRVMRDDPGAFEKYLKLNLGVTNYISHASQGGAFPSVFVPGSMWMGSVGTWGANNNPLIPHNPGTTFDNINFGLSADPGSVASVFPTGAEGGIAGFLGLFRPSWGPLITIPGKLAWQALGSSRAHSLGLKWAHAFLANALGPISINSSLYSDFFPSTVGRNLLDGAVAVANGIGINAITTSAMDSTVNLVMNNAIDNLYKQQYDRIRNTTDFSGVNSNTGVKWTNDEITVYCRAQADTAITNKFNDPEFAQNFLDQAHSAAIMMFLTKAAIAFGMPVATSIQEQFSKNPEFQSIQQEIDPLTNQKYTFASATAEFNRRYPDHIFDLTAHSQSTYSTYPETASAVAILSANPEIAKNYPYGAAYLIDRTAKYSPQAYTLEVSMNLRSKDSPREYLNAILKAAGQDYYYNYLAVQPEFGGNGNNPGNNISYSQYAALQNTAKEYGRNSNPTWYAEFAGGVRFASEIKAINDMTKMLKDPSIPESVISKDDRSKFQDLLDQYNHTVAQVKSLKSVKDSAGASSIENGWFAWCNNAALDPYYAKQAYFITSVLRSLPSK